MSDWSARWTVVLECRDQRCKRQFVVEHPDPSRELVVDGMHRLVLIGAPDHCPECVRKGLGASNVVDIRLPRPSG